MANYSIVALDEVENAFAERGWPGEMKFLTKPLKNEQVAITYRNMPQHSGGKGVYGHRHKSRRK